jgi:hypothetical protein
MGKDKQRTRVSQRFVAEVESSIAAHPTNAPIVPAHERRQDDAEDDYGAEISCVFSYWF